MQLRSDHGRYQLLLLETPALNGRPVSCFDHMGLWDRSEALTTGQGVTQDMEIGNPEALLFCAQEISLHAAWVVREDSKLFSYDSNV